MPGRDEDRRAHGPYEPRRAGGHARRLRGLGVRRRILIHLNNTNPVLLADSPERARVEAAGWEVAFDGMELRL